MIAGPGTGWFEVVRDKSDRDTRHAHAAPRGSASLGCCIGEVLNDSESERGR